MDSLLFWTAKLFWLFISPDTFLVILIVICCILLWKKYYRLLSYLFYVLTVIIVFLAFFPLGQWLLYPLESRFAPLTTLPPTIDGIIVLSGPEEPLKSLRWQQVEIGEGVERNLAFMHLVRHYPSARHVFTGGSGSMVKQKYKATIVARKLFHEQGLDTTKIIFEEQSRNTYENAKLSYLKVNPLPHEKWLLITTSWHMPRSVGVFTKVGWNVIPYAVDHVTCPGNLIRINFNFSGNLKDFKTAIKEWIGLFAYFLAGKTSTFFPGQ